MIIHLKVLFIKEFPGRRNQDVFISFNNQINNNEVVSIILESTLVWILGKV